MWSALVSLLRGRALWLSLIGISAASAAGFGAGWKLGADHIRANLYGQMQEAFRVQQEAFRRELSRRDEILRAREEALMKRQQQMWYWRKRYEQALASNEDCRKWARTPLPRCALERLRRDLSASGADADQPASRVD